MYSNRVATEFSLEVLRQRIRELDERAPRRPDPLPGWAFYAYNLSNVLERQREGES